VFAGLCGPLRVSQIVRIRFPLATGVPAALVILTASACSSSPASAGSASTTAAADEATAVAKQQSPLDKLGSALVKQLMKVVDEGVGPITGSRDYAEARLAQFGDPEKAIKRIAAETTAWSAMAGFATIAHLRGWDLQDELVRNSVLITIAGGTPNAVLAEFGVTIAQKSAEAAIKKLPLALVREINKRVGFMLVAKYGTKRSVVTLSKLVPGFGGVVGGAVDATFTRLVGRLARKSFPALAPTVDVAE
jgi:hypothetical protein